MAEEIKDSGSVRKFETGAQRDAAENKGRMDLIPLEVAAKLLGGDKVLYEINSFIQEGDAEHLLKAVQASIQYLPQFKGNIESIILETALLYEAGAKKYGENNWRLGMPLHVYIDSGTRHYLKARRGDADEPHHRGFAWNIMNGYWQYLYGTKELIDMDFPPKPKTVAK